jgi:hypothetical protein
MQEPFVAAPVLDIGNKKNSVHWQINWFGGSLSEKRSEVCQVRRRPRSRKYILVSLEQTHLWEMGVVTEFLDREKFGFICAEKFQLFVQKQSLLLYGSIEMSCCFCFFFFHRPFLGQSMLVTLVQTGSQAQAGRFHHRRVRDELMVEMGEKGNGHWLNETFSGMR